MQGVSQQRHRLSSDITRLVKTRADDQNPLSDLKIEGRFRRFLIARMGSTGSAWLAKLLCSHPDVYCSHEGIVTQMYPSKTYGVGDVARFIRFFASDTKHHAYRAVGDVGSVWSSHLPHLRPFTTALLVRHPARLLWTRLKVFPKDRSFTAFPADSQAGIRRMWGINAWDYDPLDRIFLHDLYIFATQIEAINRHVDVIRIEDMRDPACCQTTLRRLTGIHYSDALIDGAILARVNSRTGRPLPVSNVVARFSPRQQDWYRTLLADVVPHFGYELMDESGSSLEPVTRAASWSFVWSRIAKRLLRR